jgi:hypothetical protein
VSATGRFEYLLAEYLHLVENNDDPRWSASIIQALHWRWPDRWHRWLARHPDDVPEEVRRALIATGHDELLGEANDDDTTCASDAPRREGRGIGVLKTLRSSQVQAA